MVEGARHILDIRKMAKCRKIKIFVIYYISSIENNAAKYIRTNCLSISLLIVYLKLQLTRNTAYLFYKLH